MKVVKNFLYNISYQLLTIILPLITVPYVSNILGADGIGNYAYTFANTQYFIIFGLIGITLYGNRQIAYVREDKEKLKNTFYSIYLLQLITTTISLIVFIIFVLLFNTGNYRLLYIVQGLNILASMFDISWLFMGLEEFKKTVVRNTVVKFASLLSIFIFVKSHDDLLFYTIILGLSALIGNLTFWIYIPSSIGVKNIKISELNIHLKSSLALFVPQIAIQVYLLLDRTMLGLITNSAEVGYYENSQKLVKIVLTVATAVGTVMMPKIANTVALGDMKRVKYYIENSFFFISAISIPMMLGLMGIANELAPWFFTDKFAGIEKLIIVSSIVIIAISWSNVIGTQLLVPLNKTKEYTISVTFGAVINFGLNLIVLKYLGALGACISTVLAESTVTIVQFYFVRNLLDLKSMIQSIVLFIFSGIIMYIIVRIIGINMGIGIKTNILQGTIGIIIYVLGCEILFRLFKKNSLLIYIKKILEDK